MQRKLLVVCVTLGVLVALGAPAFAEIGTIDDVPAATLLLPYFQCELDNPNGLNTLFSINNASAAPTIAHITFWTDLSVPTLDFDVYLTGYDVQTINVCDIFNGNLPVTADDDNDPNDTVSPQGPFSGDASFNINTSGPCGQPSYPQGLPGDFVPGHLRPCHTGGVSNQYGGCCGAAYGDNIARGYVTIDNATQCSLEFPSAAAYWSQGVPSAVNQLWGDYFYTDTGNNFASGESLVHIEACPTPSVGTGGNCQFVDPTTGRSFYARYTNSDNREPLATTFAARYVTSASAFDGGTDLFVWRNPNTANASAGSTCAPGDAAFPWLPMSQRQVVAFDEEENARILCQQQSDVSPPPPGQPTCFPLETGRYNIESSAVPFSSSLNPQFVSGWLYLNLNTTSGDLNQAWVSYVLSALGRFSVGVDAIQLDNAAFAPIGGVVVQ